MSKCISSLINQLVMAAIWGSDTVCYPVSERIAVFPRLLNFPGIRFSELIIVKKYFLSTVGHVHVE